MATTKPPLSLRHLSHKRIPTSFLPPQRQCHSLGRTASPGTQRPVQRHVQRHVQRQVHHIHSQKRTFLSSFLPPQLPSTTNNNNNNNNGNNENEKSRLLTASRTLPYPPSALFSVISSVESYAQFLPFLTASTVTARDPETGYPTRAFLTVGYGPLSETFTSKVTCDPGTWVVEARSGAKFGVDSNQGQRGSSGSAGGIAGFLDFPGANEGVFEFLSTRWELVPLEEKSGSETTVKLEIRFEFKNMWHAKMMSALEGQMAGVMIEAFERRIKEIHG